MTEKEFASLINGVGGHLYIVGGWVRDQIRNEEPKDKDYLVAGIKEAVFCELFPEAVKTGKSFPVYRVEVEGKSCETAFARRERKAGNGYRGFEVAYDDKVTVEDDLYRRDTTMNSLAIELPQMRLIDLYGGQADIKAKKIKAISEHFCEDPVRALRAARQAAEFGFAITDEAYELMERCANELAAEPPERLLGELRRALRAARPSIFFRALDKARLLPATFPEIAALQDKIQPLAFHPEGDAYEHTLKVVDEVAAMTENIAARFAGLVHDLGKGTTPIEMLPHHYEHEMRGLEVLKKWNERMTLPSDWLKAGLYVIEQHMRAPLMSKPGKIADLLLSIRKSGLPTEDFLAVIQADHHSLPLYLEKAEELIAVMQRIGGKDAPEDLRGPAVGEWIRLQRIQLLQSKLKDFRG